ncbi:MAG: hypothetical protein ACO3A1_07990 [Flavobacteriaceae bacterium]
MQKSALLFLVFLLASCQWFAPKEALKQDILSQDRQTVDWKQVDRYPVFDGCGEEMSQTELLACFTESLSDQLSVVLKQSTTSHSLSSSDTLWGIVRVTAQGHVFMDSLSTPSVAIQDSLPLWQSRFNQVFEKMPVVAPALKRGVPVGSLYRLPMVWSAGNQVNDTLNTAIQ